MSRLDYCKYELVGDCYDWKNDNCEWCNIFRAYCEGARREKKAQNNAEPTHGRLIDADALIKKLCETTIFIKNGEVFQRMINDAPTVQADRPHGEWVDEYGNKIPLHEDGYPIDSCYCNQCHEWLVASDEYGVMGKFCPNCGADMRKEKE